MNSEKFILEKTCGERDAVNRVGRIGMILDIPRFLSVISRNLLRLSEYRKATNKEVAST